ncbi:MAG: sensor histidine kinase, partial [Spirochaetaceae bacterium]
GLMNPMAAQFLLPLTGGKKPENFLEIMEPYVPELRERMTDLQSPSGTIIGERRFRVGERDYGLEVRKVTERLFMATITEVTESLARERRVQEAVTQEAEQRGRNEIAAGALHDIGNAVTALGTTVARTLGELDWPELESLSRLQQFLRERRESLSSALGEEKVELLFELLREVESGIGGRKGDVESDLNEMAGTLSHISEILTIQRSYTSERPGILGRNVDLRRVLDDAVEMQAVSLANRQIRVERNYPEYPVSVQGDRTKLVRVAMNLLRNAAEAFDRRSSGDKERRVRISVSREKERATVIIDDNGPGFGSFDGSSKGDSGGLGLKGVASMIEAHGGGIERGDSPLGGAMVRFWLPCEEEGGGA